jgi:hypothetical protein
VAWLKVALIVCRNVAWLKVALIVCRNVAWLKVALIACWTTTPNLATLARFPKTGLISRFFFA